MAKYTHQLNCYYGIFYSADKADSVLNKLAKTQYNGLNENDSEIKVDGVTIFSSLNTDDVDISNHGFIAVDHMTIEGPAHGSPTDASLAFDPRVLVKTEEDNEAAVKIITDIYAAILRNTRGKKNPTIGIRMGWQVMACAWDDEESS